MSHFKTFIGIDYSGSGTPLTRTAGLQVYSAATNRLPERVEPPKSREGRLRNWNRKEVAEWLIRRAESNVPFIAGLDFSFSLPISYFQRHRLDGWDSFLRDFVQHWPTDRDDATVDKCRQGNARTGTNDELRVTERWTSSAKSNFQFDVQGQVAKSTHAGIPWLYRIRQAVGKKVHFWPFDGWEIRKGRSVCNSQFVAKQFALALALSSSSRFSLSKTALARRKRLRKSRREAPKTLLVSSRANLSLLVWILPQSDHPVRANRWPFPSQYPGWIVVRQRSCVPPHSERKSLPAFPQEEALINRVLMMLLKQGNNPLLDCTPVPTFIVCGRALY